MNNDTCQRAPHTHKRTRTRTNASGDREGLQRPLRREHRTPRNTRPRPFTRTVARCEFAALDFQWQQHAVCATWQRCQRGNAQKRRRSGAHEFSSADAPDTDGRRQPTTDASAQTTRRGAADECGKRHKRRNARQEIERKRGIHVVDANAVARLPLVAGLAALH